MPQNNDGRVRAVARPQQLSYFISRALSIVVEYSRQNQAARFANIYQSRGLKAESNFLSSELRAGQNEHAPLQIPPCAHRRGVCGVSSPPHAPHAMLDPTEPRWQSGGTWPPRKRRKPLSCPRMDSPPCNKAHNTRHDPRRLAQIFVGNKGGFPGF
jgi:hypothetical protein